MPTKQPTPPPKFNIGDIVYFEEVAYRVTNRRYFSGPWKYNLEEHAVLKPQHILVKEDSLSKSPLQVPPRFNVGDRVLHTAAKEVYEVQSRLWDPSRKWLYTLSRYLPHAPGAEPVTDTMYNVLEKFLLPDTKEYFDDVEGVWVEEPKQPAPQKPLFKLTDIVVYKGESFRITQIQYEFSTKTFLYDLQTKEPNSLGSYATCRAIAENEIQGDTNFETELSDGFFDQIEGKWVERPNPTDGHTVTNNQGGKQSFVSARFDCIPPVVLRLLAQCLGFGARKYGDTNYQNISMQDHLNHAMNHINEWNRGDRSEPHLVNAMARLTFALWHAVDQKQQPDTYIHPDEKQS